MGVYDHMIRPSQGHRMQVELRESMQRYHQDKAHLKQHIAQLRFDKRDLHTAPLSPLPPPVVKTWADAGSSFNKAPERAVQRAHIARLEQENSKLDKESELTGKQSLLPPIQGRHEETVKQAATDSSPGQTTTKTSEVKKQSEADSGQKTPKAPATKKPANRKVGRKKKAMKKQGLQAKGMPLLKMPIIHSASLRERNMWDSGHNHLHPKGKSTVLERNQVGEDCQNFSQRSVPILPILDLKRSEITLAPKLTQSVDKTKVKFTGRQPPPADKNQQPNLQREDQTSNTLVHDHFPQNTPRLPELEDASSVISDSEDEFDKPVNLGRLELPRLPIALASEAKTSPHGFDPTAQLLPRLPRGTTPSAMSTATGRSAATGASYMSQETLGWKGEYMTADDQHHKGRMLAEILHSVRQRMHDNEEDLRLSGNDPRPHDKWSKEGRSDIMLVHRNVTPSSGATTARSSGHHQKLMKLPHEHRKLAASGQSQGPSSTLHRYLNRLSTQRRGTDQRHGNTGAPFQLASMTIREITQSSLHTAHTAQTAT